MSPLQGPLPSGDSVSATLLAEALPQIAFLADEQKQVTYANRRWLEYTGLTLEESLADSNAALHPEDRKVAEMAWADSIAKGRPFEYELRLRRHDGVYRWHLARWVPTRDAEGRVNGWYETSTDIHQRKQAEERLLESELRYRSTFENAAVGIAHFGLDGAFLRVNDRLCRMVGYACEELLATNWQAISHPTRSR